MAKRNSTPTPFVTFHTRLDARGRPRRNLDGTQSILTIVRVPKFKPVSKTFHSQAEAEAWAVPLARELVDQKKRGGARPSLSTLIVGQLIDRYLDDPATETLKSYEDYAARAYWWRDRYGDMKVLDFGPAALHEARDALRLTGRHGVRSAGTVNRHLAVMRLIWNWGKSAGWLPLERAWPTKLLLTEPPGRIRFLSCDELDAVLAAAEADPVLRAAILVSVATGVRQGELLRLRWPDVDFANARVTILETKNATPRRVHLTSQAIAALKGMKVRSPVHVFINEAGEALESSRNWRCAGGESARRQGSSISAGTTGAPPERRFSLSTGRRSWRSAACSAIVAVDDHAVRAPRAGRSGERPRRAGRDVQGA